MRQSGVLTELHANVFSKVTKHADIFGELWEFQMASVPVSLDVRTVVVLQHHKRILLLQRAEWKKFAPGRWTGLGGKVEPHELGDLVNAATREMFEETDLKPHEVSPLQVRRFLSFYHPIEQGISLVYLTGTTASDRLPVCNEGTLHWLYPHELANLDVIENTAHVLPRLIHDIRTHDQRVHCGVAEYEADGRLRAVNFPFDVGTYSGLDTSNSEGI